MNLIKSQSHRILAVEADEFSLRAAVVQMARGRASVESFAEVKNTDPAAGLQTVLSRLGDARLPRRAVVISADVVPAVLQLPLRPDAERPWEQMQQLIRWELEAFVAQQLGPRTVGEILVCRDYLTDGQLDAIRADIGEDGGGGDGSLSLADPDVERAAVERGWVTRRQIDECLHVRERLERRMLAEDDLVCGWSAQPSAQQTAFDDDMADGLSPWLVCSVSRKTRQRWWQLFADRGIRLEGLYPLAGTSAALVSPESGGLAAVIDVRPGWLGTTLLGQGRVDGVQLQPVAQAVVSAGQCLHALGGGHVESLWLSGVYPDLGQLAGPLQDLGYQVSLMDAVAARIPDGVPPASVASMVAAASDAAGARNAAAGTIRPASVLSRDPAPPAVQQPRLWWVAAVCLAALLVGTAEGVMHWRYGHADSEATAVEENLDKLKRAADQIEHEAAQIAQLKTDVEQRQGELDDIRRRREFLEDRVPRRIRFVPSLLNTVAGAASDQVVVNRIAESAAGTVEVEAWALSLPAAQRYVQSLESRLRSWGLVMQEPRVEAKTGRLDLPGYLVQLSLKRSAAAPSKTDVSKREDLRR